MTGKASDDLLFPGPRGGGLSDRNVNTRHLGPACDRAGVKRLTFRHLRHAYCSWAVASGMPMTEVAALVGHASTRMLEKHYAHLQPNLHDRARDMLAKVRGRRNDGHSAAHPDLSG
jgi:integrase